MTKRSLLAVCLFIILLAVLTLADEASISVFKVIPQSSSVLFNFNPTTTSVTYQFPGGSQLIGTLGLDVNTLICFAPCSAKLCVYLDNDQSNAICKTIPGQGATTLQYPVIPRTASSVTIYATGLRVTVRFIAITDTVRVTQISWAGKDKAEVKRNLLSLRGSQPISLGRIREIIDVETYAGEVKVGSNDSRAAAWFDPGGGGSDTSRITTSDYNDFALACLNIDNNKDADGNPICDFEDELECASQDKDWFNGRCCGDAPYNPSSGCQWYDDKQAVCGKNAQDKWVWAALEDTGLINTLSGSCPTVQLVSDGQKFHTCSEAPSLIPAALVQKITTKITIEGHEYLCEGETIIECGGNAPYSPDAKPMGASLTIDNQKLFCSSAGKWSTSLDGDEEGCTSAGYKYTGTKCCGEPDDSLKTYEDPYTGQGTPGGCYNNQFIASGSFLGGDKKIINYRGTFSICDTSVAPGTTTTTTDPAFQNTQIIPTARGPCGTPLEEALLIGSKPNIICMPWGEWSFTSSTEETLVKQTAWQQAETEEKQGCCPDNKCWDGKNCRDIGDYYTISERGFRCQ